MTRKLQEIEGGERDGRPIYLRFSNHPVARTEAYAEGEVNVDVDQADEVVGIEMLGAEAEEIAALAEVTRAYNLSLVPLFAARKIS